MSLVGPSSQLYTMYDDGRGHHPVPLTFDTPPPPLRQRPSLPTLNMMDSLAANGNSPHRSPIFPGEAFIPSPAYTSGSDGRITPVSATLQAPAMEARLSSGSSIHDLQPHLTSEGEPQLKSTKSRRRTTQEQLRILETQFGENPKPDPARRKEMAAQLAMTPREVQVWFQNRRAKAKKLAIRAEEEEDFEGDDSLNFGEDSAAQLQHALASTSAMRQNSYSANRYPPSTLASYTASTGYGQPVPTQPPSYLPTPSYAPLTQPVIARRASMPVTHEPLRLIDAWGKPPPVMSNSSSVLTPTYGYTANARWATMPSVLQPVPSTSSGEMSGRMVDVEEGTPVPNQTAFPPYSTRPQMPDIPRMDSNDSMPSTASTGFSDFHFGSAGSGRRGSLMSDITDGGPTTPISATFPTVTSPTSSTYEAAHFFPPGYDPDARRASCPAEFIASFQHLTAGMQPATAYSNEWVQPPSRALPAFHHPYLVPGLNSGRRHSVATDYLGSYGSGEAKLSGLASAVLPPHLDGSPAYSRRGSTASLLSLDPIAEDQGGTGAIRRPSLARKARSQSSMRHLVRPHSSSSTPVPPLPTSPFELEKQSHPAELTAFPATMASSSFGIFESFDSSHQL